MIRVVKGSFTIGVERMFTASRRRAFTNARDHTVKIPASACVWCARNVD
jgi:hypothetical protein